MLNIVTIVGTRPEIIKLSCVIPLLDKVSNHTLIHTGQNFDYELNDIFFKDLKLRNPDIYLNINGGSSIENISQILIEVDILLRKIKPDAVVIYGDTNSCLSVISAKKLKIPIFHLEAGNRSFDENIPEELNRKIVDHLSDINLTLNEHARRYLLNEGILPDTIFNVGSLLPEVISRNIDDIIKSNVLKNLQLTKGCYFVASIHREENVDNRESLSKLLQLFDKVSSYYEIPIILSTHPRTLSKINDFNIKINNNLLRLVKPMGFFDYLKLQIDSKCVLSDSGTLTEESSILGFNGIMLRTTHERPEGFDAGVTILNDYNYPHIIDNINTLLLLNKSNKIKDFDCEFVSQKVIKIILSYVSIIKNRKYG